jgi:AcrR family transcriptional regulator
MLRKSNLARRRRPQPRVVGKVRLREEFREYARAAILEAAEQVLADQGLHAARIEEIARKARVAVGTIYNLIGDRDALVVEILKLRHQEVLSLLGSTLEEVRSRPFRAQAEAVVVALFGYLREHWRFFRLVLESETGPACSHKRVSQDTRAEVLRLHRELIARGVRERALRPEGRELYPTVLTSIMRAVLIHDLETEYAGSPEERAAQVIDLFIHGAGPK